MLTDAEPHERVGFADLLSLVPHLEKQLWALAADIAATSKNA